MGWSYNTVPGGFKDLIAELTHDWHSQLNNYRCVAKCFRGNVRHSGNLWALIERSPRSSEGLPYRKFIALFLLKCQGGCWGWKSMDEDWGPCEDNCPISYVKEASPPETEHSVDWRKRVVSRHEELGRKLKVGSLYRLKKNNFDLQRVKLTKLRPLYGICERNYQIKVKRSLLGPEIPEDETAWQLLKQAEEHPEDPSFRLIYADRLDELGYGKLAEEARCASV